MAFFSLILWTPFSNWFIEIFSPNTKPFVLNAFFLTVAVILLKSTSSQSRRKQIALKTVAIFLLIAGCLSLWLLSISIIAEPLYTFGWNTDTHNIQVGSHHIEARKTGLFNLSSGSAEIVVREVQPLSTRIRLVRQPIADEVAVTGVDLHKIDNNSFSYQFVGDDEDYPVCKVHFNN